MLLSKEYLSGAWRNNSFIGILHIKDFLNTKYSISDDKTCIIFSMETNFWRHSLLDDDILKSRIKESLARITINERFFHGGQALFKSGRPFIWEYSLQEDLILITQKSIQLFYFPRTTKKQNVKHIDNKKFDAFVILNIVFCDDNNTISSNI